MNKIDNQKFKITNVPAIFLALLGLMFAVASFFTISSEFSRIANSVIFYGSLITTGAAIIVPLLSFKMFGLNSYKIKLYSLYFGILALIILYLGEMLGYEIIHVLKEYSKKGLLWGMNTAILLFNLTYLEIENHGLKNQEIADLLKRKDEEIIEQYEKRISDKKKYEKEIDEMKNSKK